MTSGKRTRTWPQRLAVLGFNRPSTAPGKGRDETARMASRGVNEHLFFEDYACCEVWFGSV
jgi:hypothetical protein